MRFRIGLVRIGSVFLGPDMYSLFPTRFFGASLYHPLEHAFAWVAVLEVDINTNLIGWGLSRFC